MKKNIIFTLIILLLFSLFSCTDPSMGIQPKQSEMILKYNEWGTAAYSYFQTDSLIFSEKFNGTLSTDGKSLTYSWSGKSNRDVKKLYLIISDIEYYYDEGVEKIPDNRRERWSHLLNEEHRATPVKTDIKANTEFQLSGTISLDKMPILAANHVIGVFLACGADDADGPVHLYFTEEEDTAEYNSYMTEKGNAIMNRGITISDSDKGTLSISGTDVGFTSLPKIKLSDGKIYDASKEEEKAVLLEKGYFAIHLLCDDFNSDFYLVIGKDITNENSNLIGNWGIIGSDFNNYSFADKFKSETRTNPVFAECSYFEYKDDNRNCYFPIKVFKNIKK